MGTLYTAVYRPSLGRVSYLWPEHRWDVGLEGPLEGALHIDYATFMPKGNSSGNGRGTPEH
jgi:hypothetical protein